MSSDEYGSSSILISEEYTNGSIAVSGSNWTNIVLFSSLEKRFRLRFFSMINDNWASNHLYTQLAIRTMGNTTYNYSRDVLPNDNMILSYLWPSVTGIWPRTDHSRVNIIIPPFSDIFLHCLVTSAAFFQLYATLIIEEVNNE